MRRDAKPPRDDRLRAHRDRFGRWHTTGRQALAQIVERCSARSVAQRLSVTLATVSALVNGVRRPGIDLASDIEAAYGIPPAAWSTPPVPAATPADGKI